MRLRMKNDLLSLIKNKAVTISLVSGAALITVAFLVGWFSALHWYRSEHEPVHKSEQHLGLQAFGYQFINPLLSCESAAESIEDRELRPFQQTVEQFIDDQIKQKHVSKVSVRFREMNNGLSFAIRGSEKFAPASLLKVPTMMAYFKWAESSPRLLTTTATYDTAIGDQNIGQYYQPAETIVPGKSYTFDELLYRSIVFSDNNANTILFNKLPPRILQKVYTDLGVPLPLARKDRDAEMSVTEYSAFFRILFNASYLTRDYSEKALTLLAATEFPNGLAAGVPRNIIVAQKFGERITGERNELLQLHDCGIVYYPEHPYLLCVMTRGASFEDLADTIKDISRVVYTEVDRHYRAP